MDPIDWIIKNGRVVCPENGLDQPMDLAVGQGRILWIGPPGRCPHTGRPEQILDASGLVVAPGLVDIHVHLRQPGQEHKETIQTGSRAAAAGGFTSVFCMPNTDPVNDNPQVTRLIKEAAARAGNSRVYPVGALTLGMEGRKCCDYRALALAGCKAVSDDGKWVTDSSVMRRAMVKAHEAGLKIFSHSEDGALAAKGVINEGTVAEKLSVSGIPWAAESIGIERDIALCELTGVPIHLCHVSTLQSVRAIRRAKERGLPVTAETAPHYFALTHQAVVQCQANAKMNPPLRTESDRRAMEKGLADGILDAIATDHAPHSPEEKAAGLEAAPFGIVGLETSLGLGLELVEKGILNLKELLEKMSVNPARIGGLVYQGLCKGAVADLFAFDPKNSREVRADKFYSKGRNTPFEGRYLKGEVFWTMTGGKLNMQRTQS